MTIYITGIGTWLPPRVRTNDEWPQEFFDKAAQRTGDRTFNDIAPSSDAKMASIVEKDLAAEALDPMLGTTLRHVAHDNVPSWRSEANAAEAALADAGLSASHIDLVLSFSMVPDRVVPASGVRVAYEIGAFSAQAICVDTVCASVITQMEVARAYLEAGLATNVLCVQSHLMLRTVPILHPASPGLGDGSSAIIVSKTKGPYKVLSTYGVTHGEYADAVVWLRGTDDATDPPWYLTGGPFRAGSRDIAGAKFLMNETAAFGADAIQTAAFRANIDVNQISVIASVQPRGFLPGAIAQGLSLPKEIAVTTYSEIAHVGACGPVFNLKKAGQLGLTPPGALIALYGQGAGFTRAAAILQAE